MPCVRDVCPLVGPAEGDGDLRPGAIAGVGDSILCVDGEHPAGGELSIPSAFVGGGTPEDGGDHLVVVLEGVIIIPMWSAFSVPTIIIVVLFLLEVLSQTKAIFHLVFGVLV